jgi:hypothetical protein
MAAISHRIAGPGPRGAAAAPPRSGRHAAVIAAAAAKGAQRARALALEGASDELRAAAAQCLDWAPARRRVRAAFAPVLPTLDHCLFKVRVPRRSSSDWVSYAAAVARGLKLSKLALGKWSSSTLASCHLIKVAGRASRKYSTGRICSIGTRISSSCVPLQAQQVSSITMESLRMTCTSGQGSPVLQ